MPTLPAQLERELGTSRVTTATAPADETRVDAGESTRELMWPASVAIYESMRRSDSGIRAALRAVKLPILSTRWSVKGRAGVREDVRRFVEVELGLASDEDGRLRSREGGVQWEQLLSEVLTCIDFGHSVFEQLYAMGPPDDVELIGTRGLAQVAHLRKLAFRPQPSLASIDVARDGGLEGVHQYLSLPDGRVVTVGIPVDRLAVFVNEREGANWLGTSVLRSAYKHWMIRDVLIRLSAIAVDRTGMGLPVVSFDEAVPGARTAALKVASSVRGGEDSGVALPSHMALTLLGVTGTTMDPLPLIRYHEQAASKSVLAMFLDLGHDTGARSLGDTFVDYFLLGVQAVTRMIESTMSDHVVRDLVRINFGPNEPWPVVRADPIDAEATPTAGALSQLALAGLLGPIEAELVAEVRRRYNMPALPAGTPIDPTPGGGDAQGVVDDTTTSLPGGNDTAGNRAGDPGLGSPERSPLAGVPDGRRTGGVAGRIVGVNVPGTPGSRLSEDGAGGAGGWAGDLSERVAMLSQAVSALVAGGAGAP